jgi:uncharacterized membrane protein YdjX (TVP38/TMEM64 family)
MNFESLRRHRHRIGVAALWLAIIAGYQVWAIRSGLGPGESVRRLVDALQESTWGLVAYAGIYVLRPLVLFPATLLTIAGGFLFGPWLGLAVVLVASNVSALVAYGVGRWFGTGALTADVAQGRLARYVQRMRERSFETVLILRLLLAPYDVISYLAGFLRIGLVPFAAGTAIGSLPGTVAFVLFGASIEKFDGGIPSLDPKTLVASFVLLAISLALVRVVRRREGVVDAA